MSNGHDNQLTELPGRLRVARDAAIEIEALAIVLQSIAKGDDVDRHAVRGLSMRLQELAGIVMGAVGDAEDPVRELRFRLLGTLASHSSEPG